MRRIVIAAVGLGIAAGIAAGSTTNSYSWEDGGTILGRYGNVANEMAVAGGSDPGKNNQEQTHIIPLPVTPRTGGKMLQVDEDPHSGTPQAYVAWIKGVSGGDEVTASMWGWDSTPSSPRLRLWAHYSLTNDVNSNDGYTGEGSSYTTGTGEWNQVSHTWTIEAGKEALVIEARLYSTPSSSATNSTTFWVDDLELIVPDGATVTFPEGTTAPSGTVRYVSSYSGMDTGNGADPAAPCKSIQYAVDQAGSGDEIRIASYDVLMEGSPFPTLQSNACVYTGPGASVIALNSGSSVTLKGGYIYNHVAPGVPQWIPAVIPSKVDGQGARRGLYAMGADGDTNRVELLEFVNGSANNGGNVYAEGGSLQLVGTPIHHGTATGNGGGVYMSGVDFSVSLGSYSNLSLPQLTGLLPIYSNSAARGGGLYLDGGYPVVTTVGIVDNTSTTNGGGVYINGGYPSVVGGTIQGNTSGGNGGAIYLSQSVARVGGMVITSNRAVRGGAIYLDGPFAFSMETATLIANNYIQDNVSTGEKGGAVFFNTANVGMVNNVITGNRATEGSAAYMYSSSPRFLQNTIADNQGISALFVTHDAGEGRWVETPEVRNPWPPYNVIVPAGSNYIAGIPVPSWPQFTNTIISGHLTGMNVADTGNEFLANKVEMGYTLWYSNLYDTAGAGAGNVNHHDDVYGDPLYTSKGTAPNDLMPYHVETNSPAVDNGVAVGLTLPGTDLLLDIDAQLRPSGEGMDIGADEVVTDPFSVWFVPPAIARTVQPGEVVTNEHILLNSGTQNDTYDIAASNSLWSGSISPGVVSLDAQTYTSVTVIVTVPGGAADGDTNTTVAKAVSQTDSNRMAVAVDTSGISTNMGAGDMRYVWHSSPNPRAPYTTPETAGHDIQTVVDVCVDGDTVIVYPGVYDAGGRPLAAHALTNRVCATNAIVIQSLNGASNTVIMGAADPGSTNGPAAVRGACLRGGALLADFLITGGHTLSSGSADSDRRGGGVSVADGGVLSNCVVKASSADEKGGGVSVAGDNITINSQIKANTAVEGGGGAYVRDAAKLERCWVSDNVATSGGGAGGGVHLQGGGSARNSLIAGNRAGEVGGGVCTKDDNGAVPLLRNCTVIGNEAKFGGGLCDVTGLPNDGATTDSCIVYFNTGTITGQNWHVVSGKPSFLYSCTAPTNGLEVHNSESCIADDPQFVSMRDLHLKPSSPAIDSGAPWITGSFDLDGSPRPLLGATTGVAIVDMGCYEHRNPDADSDGDGMKDSDEEIAGTDPRNPSSVFRITGISNNSPATVFYDSSAGRFYTLQGRSVLGAGDWAEITGKPGSGGEDSMTDTNVPPRGPFYRLRVARPGP